MAVRQMLVVGRYRLLEPVGAGGMGRVWLSRDEMLDRDVAIKEIVPPDWMTEAEKDRLRDRTLREARSAARLNHPHVVRIYDVVHDEGQSWIVMEYIPSRSLHQVLREEGPYDPAGAARIGLAVLDALDSAHRAGVLHRDVKPHNVLIGTDGRVVLTDFGLATFVDDGTVTAPGLIVGSPQYVSPERARDGASTVESDLWSLGATVYAAVEGRSPYARETAMATLAALATEQPDPPVRAGPLTPILEGLLQYDPLDRLTATEVENRLRLIVGIDHREVPLVPGQRGVRHHRPEEPRKPADGAVFKNPDESAPPVVLTESEADGPRNPDTSDRQGSAGIESVRASGPGEDVEDDLAGAAVPERRRESPMATPADPPVVASPAVASLVTAPPVAASPVAASPVAASPVAADDSITTPLRQGSQALLPFTPQQAAAPSGRIPERTARPRRRPLRGVVHARSAVIVGVVIVLVGGSVSAGYLAQKSRPRAHVVLPTAPSASAVPTTVTPSGRSPGVSAQPGVVSPPSVAVPTTAVADRNGFSPVVCDSPPPPDVRETPKKGAARGVNGWSLLAGWSYFTDRSGFHIAVPDGWTYQRIGTTYCFRDPGSSLVMSLDAGRDASADPVRACHAEEARLKQDEAVAGYSLISITAVPLLHKAADWDYRYQAQDGEPRRASLRWFAVNGRAYAIGWATPEKAWPEHLSKIQMVRSTFFADRAGRTPTAAAGHR
ncbi:protein kinase [Actinoplanes sp. NBC_00393]|uniref:serine/threonine-protein kinase n=1 Tax=Actinoplanes sp. NBC_00393 TaxID=2975953 RepID=UPI002E1BCDD2